MPEDGPLLRTYHETGDQSAFAALVKKYLPLTYSVAVRQCRGNTAMAEDVAQRVFTDLARKSRSLEKHPSLAAWLVRAAHYTAIDLVRAEARRQAREKAAMPMLLNEPAPDWEKVRPAIDAALSELSEPDRAAVLLRCFEARPFREIAVALHTTEDAARMRFDRALERLRTHLGRRGITSTAALLASALAGQASIVPPATLATTITTVTTAAVGGSAGLAPLLLMTTSKTATLTVIAIALALSFSAFEYHQASTANAAAADTRLQLDAAERRAVTLEAKLRLVTPRPEQTATPLNSPRDSGMPTAGVPAAPASVVDLVGRVQSANPLSSVYQLAKTDPEAAEAWLAAERSALDLQYGPLVDQLGLSPAQANRLKAILMEKFQGTADITAAASAQGLPMTDPGVRAMFKDLTTKTEGELHELLGDTGVQQLRQYGETLPIRQFVGSLAGDVYASAPLTPGQADQLVALITSHTKPGSGGYAISGTDWDAVLADAPKLLTPPQLAPLKAERDQIVLRQQLQRLAKPPAR